MNYRVLPLGTYPDQLFRHIQAASCFIRCETTEVRGPVALVGNGFIWAVAELSNVKPATKGKEAPQGYLWCLRNLQVVEGVTCTDYTVPAMFKNGDAWEPQMLQASAQAELNRLLEPVEARELIEVPLQISVALDGSASTLSVVVPEDPPKFAEAPCPKASSVSTPEMQKSAVISECGKYRYELRRVWDEAKGLVNFVMLNPSRADAEEPDPTMTRCLNFARDWGYGGIILTNLFAYRLTDSKKLRYAPSPEGPEMWSYVDDAAKEAQLVVAAWGDHKMARIQGDKMRRRLEDELGIELKCIKQTKPGVPWHPLYLPGDLVPILFEPFEVEASVTGIVVTEDLVTPEILDDSMAATMPPDYQPDMTGLSRKERKLVEAGQMGLF